MDKPACSSPDSTSPPGNSNSDIKTAEMENEVIEIDLEDDVEEIIEIDSDAEDGNQPDIVSIPSEDETDEIVEIPVEKKPDEVIDIPSDDENSIFSEDPSNSEGETAPSPKNFSLSKCYVSLHDIIVDRLKISSCTKCIISPADDLKNIKIEFVVKREGKRLQCHLCLNFYSSELYLKYHACAADKEEEEEECSQKRRLFVCNNCGMNFKDEYMLKRHVIVTHTKEKVYACRKCGKEFKKKYDLKTHLRSHFTQECKDCGKNFAHKTDLLRHIRTHVSLKCKYCSFVCKNPDFLKEHEKIHANESNSRQKPEKENFIEAKERQNSFDCNDCGKNFKQRIQLKQHIFKNHIKEPNEVRKMKLYVCNQCQKVFTKKSDLEEHEGVHDKESFACNVCDKVFNRKSTLKNHLLSQHIVNISYDCNICGKSFPRNRYLKKHLATHTGEKPHVCPECGKAFTVKGNLHKHRQSHYIEQLYFCCHCDKSFKESSSLKRHKLTHKTRKFRCDKCEKSFERKSHLRSHYVSHRNNFVCNECRKSFRTKEQLKIHFRRHFDKKSHVCHVCERSFKEEAHLNTHLRCHSNKRYSCDFCGDSFKLEANLKKHQRFQHQIFHHEEVKRHHACETCGKIFSRKLHLLYHIRSHSDDVQTYFCDKCGKSFKGEEPLKKHDCKSLYVCSECGASFSFLASLKSHQRSHTDVKTFECAKCGSTFISELNLKKHGPMSCARRLKKLRARRMVGEVKIDQKIDGGNCNKEKLHPEGLDHRNVSDVKTSDSSEAKSVQKLETEEMSQENVKRNVEASKVETTCTSREKINLTESLAVSFEPGQSLACSDDTPYLCEMCGEIVTRTTHLNCRLKAEFDSDPKAEDCKEKNAATVAPKLTSEKIPDKETDHSGQAVHVSVIVSPTKNLKADLDRKPEGDKFKDAALMKKLNFSDVMANNCGGTLLSGEIGHLSSENATEKNAESALGDLIKNFLDEKTSNCGQSVLVTQTEPLNYHVEPHNKLFKEKHSATVMKEVSDKKTDECALLSDLNCHLDNDFDQIPDGRFFMKKLHSATDRFHPQRLIRAETSSQHQNPDIAQRIRNKFQSLVENPAAETVFLSPEIYNGANVKVNYPSTKIPLPPITTFMSPKIYNGGNLTINYPSNILPPPPPYPYPNQIYNGRPAMEFICKECGKAFKREEYLKQHLSRDHNPNLLSCDKCGRKFTQFTHLQWHQSGACLSRINNQPFSVALQESILKRDKCERKFTHFNDLQRHQSTACLSRINNQPTSGTLQESILKRDKCERKFTHFNDLQRHQSTACLNSINNQNPSGTLQEDLRFPCNKCGRTYKKMVYLKRHLKSHDYVKSYTCKKCGEAYEEYSNLYTHMKYNHQTDATPSASPNDLELKSDSAQPVNNDNKNEYNCDNSGKSFKQDVDFLIYSQGDSGRSSVSEQSVQPLKIEEPLCTISTPENKSD